MCAVVDAVVLAAGAASRFGSPKQRLLLAPVLERLRRASTIDDVVVVVGAHDLETDARTIHCAEWERGPGASLRCGLGALPSGTEAAVVVLADGPKLAPEAIERVAAAVLYATALGIEQDEARALARLPVEPKPPRFSRARIVTVAAAIVLLAALGVALLGGFGGSSRVLGGNTARNHATQPLPPAWRL